MTHRFAAVIAAGTLLTATACSSGPSTPAPAITTTTAATTTTASSAPSATAQQLTWGSTASSVEVDITPGTPLKGAARDSGGTFWDVPVTVANKSYGRAKLSFSGRVGGVEATAYADPSVSTGPFQPGQTVTTRAHLLVPAGATGALTLTVRVNLNELPNPNPDLVFTGPLG